MVDVAKVSMFGIPSASLIGMPIMELLDLSMTKAL